MDRLYAGNAGAISGQGDLVERGSHQTSLATRHKKSPLTEAVLCLAGARDSTFNLKYMNDMDLI